MDPMAAEVVLTVIAGIGAVVWLAGAQFLVSSYRRGNKGSHGEMGWHEESDAVSRGRLLAGSAEIEGDPLTLTDKAVSALVKENALGMIKVTSKAVDAITFDRIATGDHSSGSCFYRGAMVFEPVSSGQTRITWSLELASMRWMLLLGAAFQFLGLMALIAGFWLIATFVVSAPDPAVRWQTLQMLQVVHFLWPPFLFGALYRGAGRQVAAQFEAFVNNLPYRDIHIPAKGS
jgi:hypothetical protein